MAQLRLPGHGNQSVHLHSHPPGEAHYETNPTFPTPRSQPHVPNPTFPIVLGAGLVPLMLLLLVEPGFAATNSLTPTANTLLRQSPPWASRMQSRASFNPALREAWGTNVSSLAAGRTAPQARQNLVLGEVGPNHRSWKRELDASTPAATNRFARARASAGPRVVEIATGMNYWDGGKYSPSDASFELTEDAFVADRVQHRTRLNADLNVIGAVTTSLVDGTTLRSTPVAIGLYNPDDGRFAVISTVTNSVGVLVASNQVVYPDAFSGGVCASVVFTLQKGSFEQDVVITGRLDPREYGFPTNAQIQVITEFYDAPQPEKVRRPLYVEQNEAVRRRKASPDLVDEVLGFSELVIGTGRAYTPPSAAHPEGTQAVVAKEFRTIPEFGRTFLIETVNCLSIQNALDALPDCGQESGAAQRIRGSRAGDGYAFIPKPAQTAQASATPRTSSGQFAHLGNPARSGVVIDYFAELGGTISTTKTFQGDTTYLVADNVYCNGPVILENAVFKYKAGTTIKLNSSLICRTSSYRPATFTALDDNSIGEQLNFDLDYTGVIDPDGYANPALWSYWLNGPNLSNLRFCYAKEAIRLEGSQVSATLSHAQLVNCIRGINLVSVVVSSGSSGAGVYLTVNNALLANVDWALTQSYSTGSGSGGSATFNHCTVAQADALISAAQSFPTSFKNSIFANVTSLGAPTPSGSYNGFYSTPPQSPSLFGDPNNRWTSGSDPFQSSGGGAYYLRADSEFREKGTTAGLPATLLTALKSKATQPPIEFPRFMLLSGELTLFPQTPQYVSGPPDLGFWYDALDFTVANMILDGGSITVQPGTAIAVRNDSYIWYDEFENPWAAFTTRGFVLLDGASFNSQGTPQAPNTFTTVELVQDGTPSPYGAPFGKWPWIPCRAELFTIAGYDPEPNLSFRFSSFSVPPTWCYHFISGYDGRPQYVSWINTSSLGLSLHDCNLAGGELDLGYATYDPNTFEQYPGVAHLNWQNTLFDRVYINLNPASQPASPSVDFAFEARNNLFRGGQLRLAPVVSSSGNWVFKDNLFDKVPFVQDTTEPLDHDYNGYWKRLSGELEWWQADRLSPDAANDRVLTSAPVYYVGPLGNFYRAPSGPLYQTGSRTAAEAGLAQYTIQPNQTKNNAGSPVSIGLHYVATASYSSAQPKDTDGDGIPDYIEDANGDGQWGEGLETKINATHTETAVHDSVNVIYDDIDLSGSGLVGRIKKALGLDAFDTGNPLSLVQITTGHEPDIVSFKVGRQVGGQFTALDYDLLTSIGVLRLNLDGFDVTLQNSARANSGNGALLRWNTTYEDPGQHFLQARLALNGTGVDTAVLSGLGVLVPFYSANVCRFFECDALFDAYGAYLDAQLPVPNATYSIRLYDPFTTPPTLLKTIPTKSTSSGMIQEDWDLTCDQGPSPFAGSTFDAVFDITLLAEDGSTPIAHGTPTKRHSAVVTTEQGNGFDVAYMLTSPYSGLAAEFSSPYGKVWMGMQGVVDTLTQPVWPWPPPGWYVSSFNHFTSSLPPPAYPGYLDSMVDVTAFLLPSLSDGLTKNFFCYAHGSANSLQNSTGDVKIEAGVVGAFLGNRGLPDFPFVVAPSYPYRFVFLDGCSTASDNQWRHAFGILPIGPDNQAARHKHQSFRPLIPRFLSHGVLGTVYGLIILCASAAIADDQEPSYNGRLLSEWLGDMRLSALGSGPYEAAVRGMGTNAIPTLLKWMSYEPSSSDLSRETEEKVMHWRPVTNLNRYPAQRALRASYAFFDLGPAARPAIPELTRLARASSGPKQADLFVRALASIGPAAVPGLVSLATNSASWTRYEAVSWLGRFADDPAVAAPLVPMLVSFLCDASINTNTDYAVEGPAQAALLAMDPQVVVPALTNALQSSSDRTRRQAVATLLAFQVQNPTNVPPTAVPILRAAMRDPDSVVRDVATGILREMGGWQRVGEEWVRRHGTNTLNGITPDFFTNAPPR